MTIELLKAEQAGEKVHILSHVPAGALLPCFIFPCILFVLLVLSFLSDPSPIIGNACHLLTHSLTHSLTDSRLVNLIDVTLACEDANSKLFLLRMLKLRIMLATFVADLGTKV